MRTAEGVGPYGWCIFAFSSGEGGPLAVDEEGDFVRAIDPKSAADKRTAYKFLCFLLSKQTAFRCLVGKSK